MRSIKSVSLLFLPDTPFRFASWTALLLFLILGSPAIAQQKAPGSPPAIVPRVDLSAGFDYVRANAPPSGCKCFNAYGGYASAGFYLNNWFSIAGQFTGAQGSDISTLGQGLTLFTYTGGPRFTIPGRRISPFAEGLFGEAHATNSYFPTSNGGSESSASSFALIAGGGIDYKLTSHVAVRASGEYLRTAFPNGSSGAQNHLLLSGGIVYRIGQKNHDRPREAPMPPVAIQPVQPAPVPTPEPAPAPAPPPPPPPAQTVTLACSAAATTINPGDTLEVSGHADTTPATLPVTYTWVTGVGKLIGSGAQVLVDTFGVPPGSYHVIGHVAAEGSQPLTADCDVPFRIHTIAEAVQAPTPLPTPPVDAAKEKEFHDNVPDALFDYDKAIIRPDTQRAIVHAAGYLAAHPDIRVLLGGYADNRGSLEYNLVLGEKRARTVRAAMIAAGVAPERLEIVTYGKFVQVCTANTEQCRQLNRRVAFAMHP